MADLPSDARDPSADHAHVTMDWPRIPGYRIKARIGAGGMAEVFRAHEERLRRPVALKILAPALASDDGFRRRFIREARAAAMVDDPHIIPVFEAGEAGRLLFIAMRFVAGGDVRSLLSRSGAMSPGRATGIVSAAASALDAAHRAGLVHRDVKPANMLIDVRPGRPDHIYLSDFGLSKGALSAGGVTRAGHVVGTPAYLAPEQASGGKVDGRTDQYSLACAAYELLTGMPPFPRDDAAAMIYAHLWEPPPPATAQHPSLPSAVDSVLARAMSKDPEQRFLTCQEFAESLRTALGLRPYDADPGMSISDNAGDGTPRHGAPIAAVTPDGRDVSPATWPSRSPGAAGPSPGSARPGRAPGGEGAPAGPDRAPPGVRPAMRARTRRRAERLSLTALTLAALTLVGVVIGVRALRSPELPPVLAGAFKPVPGQLARVSAGPNGLTLAAGHTCSECGTTVETDRPLLLMRNGPEWSRLALPDVPGSPRLTGVSVSADGTIYAVGYTCLPRCGATPETDRPLILRWRGGAWSRFARPSTIKPARLTGVSVTTTGTVFVVGYTCKGECSNGLAVSGDRPLILRWNGSRWSGVTSPSLRDGDSLSAVSSQPGGNVWVAGAACTTSCRALIVRWDGSAWRRVASPGYGAYAQLLDISTTAASGWATGFYSCTRPCGPPGARSETLILRWDGHSWSRAKSPSVGRVNALAAISAAGGTTWAGGIPSCGLPPCGSPPVYRTVILRWNGSDWWRVTPSPIGNWWLTGIAAEPGGGAIAVGHACTYGCGSGSELDHTLILRWNGSSWSAMR